MKALQKGFTLIELVVVMVILGILAAFAVPKFYDFGSQARIADLNGLMGAINSATVTAHGAALARGFTAASGQNISMEGAQVDLVYGYPAAATSTTTGINAAMSYSTTTFTTTYPTATTTTYTLGNCSVTYTQAANATTPPTVTTSPVSLANC